MANTPRRRGEPIRVLLVDDSAVALAVLNRMLESSPDVEVVGRARTGAEALELIERKDPHVVCTDLHMSPMNGLVLIQTVMERFPRPILVVSASVSGPDTKQAFELIAAGALDVFPKPQFASLMKDDPVAARAFVSKVRVLAGVVVIRKRSRGTTEGRVAPRRGIRASQPRQRARIVALGASTGGPVAVQTILSQLPPDFGAPLILVQHLSAGFLEGFVQFLRSRTRLKIVIAREGDRPVSGTCYLPSEGCHLVVNHGDEFRFGLVPAVGGHVPSVSVTMKSVAERYGSGACGVLLTGMGRDGAEGMKAIFDAGGSTIAQDEDTSVVFGMPKAAIEQGAAGEVLPLSEIAGTLQGLT